MLELPINDIEILLALEKKINNLKQKILESEQELNQLEFQKPTVLAQISIEQAQKVEQEVEKENLVKAIVSAKNKEQKELTELEKIARAELLQWLKHQDSSKVSAQEDLISIQELPQTITVDGKELSVSQIIKKLIT